MNYEITITKRTKELEVEKTYKKIADTGNERDNGPVYGYVSNETEVVREEIIYRQALSKEIDLKKIIKAVNDIYESKSGRP